MKREKWPFELNLLRIKDDELIYARKPENVEKANDKNKFAPKALSDKYVFSPSSYLSGKWLYKNMETAWTNHLWLAWWFRFCTHKFSCAENVLWKASIISGLYMLIRTPFKWLIWKFFEDNEIQKSNSFTSKPAFAFFETLSVTSLILWVVWECFESYNHERKDKKRDRLIGRKGMLA